MLNLIPVFLDFLLTGAQAAIRIAEKFIGPCKDNETHLYSLEITRSRDDCRGSQPLLHRSKPGRSLTSGKKLHILLRVKAKMSEYHARHHINGRAKALDRYRFAF